MHTILAALTAQYIHSALAIRYLKSYCQDHFTDITIMEFTINHELDYIISEIYRQQPEILGLSCYIWNIELTLKVAAALKQIMPDLIIVLGGPEVSFDPLSTLADHPFIDFIICGEGEVPFFQLLTSLHQSSSIDWIPSLAYRDDNGIPRQNPLAPPPDLKDLPSPYRTSQLVAGLEQNKIVYYECSRGCPFRCAYCLSGARGKVRQLPIERAKQELTRLAAAGVKQINFVDRTFNFDRDYALELFRFLAQIDTTTVFHFEICADLLDDATIEFLQTVPAGRFEFEIGVQSTNEVTLQHVNRHSNFSIIARRVEQIRAGDNIHQHLDLIAGLPHEDLVSFRRSFNDVYRLKPDMLQLGFLKLLKGSQLRARAHEYSYKYRSFPPYEVAATPWLSFQDLLELKDVESVLSIFYNSHLFDNTINYLETIVPDPYSLYRELAVFCRAGGYHTHPHRLETKYHILFKFGTGSLGLEPMVLRELLKLDMLEHARHRQIPPWMESRPPENYRRVLNKLLNDQDFIASTLPHLRGNSYKQLLKWLQLETFELDILELISTGKAVKRQCWALFDYSSQTKPGRYKKAQYHVLYL